MPRILNEADIEAVKQVMSSRMGPTDVYLMRLVPNLLATIEALRQALSAWQTWGEDSSGIGSPTFDKALELTHEALKEVQP